MQNYFVLGFVVILISLNGCVSPRGHEGNSKTTGVQQDLVAKEKQIWEAYKHKNAAALSALTRDDSYSVEDANGEIITKAEALADLPHFTIDDYTMKDFQIIPINSGAAILRYSVMVKGSSNGTPFTPHWSIVSSVWVETNGQWKNLLYQETQVQH
ncbi:MAG: nuclear transport factor 2 family protein, partial [Verrucomicrobiota bacterium]